MSCLLRKDFSVTKSIKIQGRSLWNSFWVQAKYISKQLEKPEFKCQKLQILSQALRADSPMFALGFTRVCWIKSEFIYRKVLLRPKRNSKQNRQVQTTKIRVFIFILQIWNIWKALRKLNFCQVFWNSYHLICLHYIYLVKTHVALFLEVRVYAWTATCRDGKCLLKLFVSKSLSLLLCLSTHATCIATGMKAPPAVKEQQPNAFNVLPDKEGRERSGQEPRASS